MRYLDTSDCEHLEGGGNIASGNRELLGLKSHRCPMPGSAMTRERPALAPFSVSQSRQHMALSYENPRARKTDFE